MPKKITIELNERQARILLHAVEVWFRLMMGQRSELSDDVAFYGYRHDEDKPNEFDRRIQNRNAIDCVIDAMFRIAWPPYGTPEKIEDDTHVASDIWSVLRYELSPKNGWQSTPFQMSTEPLPTITVEEVPDNG